MVDELDRYIGEYVKISKIFLFLEEKKGKYYMEILWFSVYCIYKKLYYKIYMFRIY